MVEGDALMSVRREAERNVRKRLAAFGSALEGEFYRQIGALDQVVLPGEEVVHHVRQRPVGWSEACGQKIRQGVRYFGVQRGGDHGQSLSSWDVRIGTIRRPDLQFGSLTWCAQAVYSPGIRGVSRLLPFPLRTGWLW